MTPAPLATGELPGRATVPPQAAAALRLMLNRIEAA